MLTTSSAFFAPPPRGMTHYISTKGALLGFVRGLATEVGGNGITVNALAPGLTRTKHAVKNVPQQHFDYVVSHQAVKRNGEPEDQAAAVSFLASEDAAFVTGQVLRVVTCTGMALPVAVSILVRSGMNRSVTGLLIARAPVWLMLY